MNGKTMGLTLGLAALLGVGIWAGAGSQAAPQGPEDASRPALSDRAAGPASQALVTAAPRPGAASAALATEDIVPRTQELGPEQRSKVLGSYGRLPLSFIENHGQVDTRIAYYIQSPGRSLYFTKDGHALRLTQGKGEDARAHTIKVELVGAAAERIESLERAPGIVSYFKGPKAEWKTAIPTHARIGYVQPWPGIDLAYAGHGGRLESIYTVAPHADPAQIKLRYSGQGSLALDEDGNLVIHTSLGEIKESAPILYQEIQGTRHPVEGRFILLDEATVAFEVVAYDPDSPLVIDPVLSYSTYLGGSGLDRGLGIAVDASGNAYVTGLTGSINFPIVNPVQPAFGGGFYDVFVTKVNADGTALVYSTYLGGSGDESLLRARIAVDTLGNAYVTGGTSSTNFPTTPGAFQPIIGGFFSDAFVTKLGPDGSELVYSTYLGGSGHDEGFDIAVDVSGNAYVTGRTSSTNFPTTPGALDSTHNGDDDAFVANFNASGSALIYSTYLGGSFFDRGLGIAVDGSGNAYVAGYTGSASFPTTVGAFQTGFAGSEDAFVAKVSATGSALVYSTYLGGSSSDAASDIAVDSSGNAYVTGVTQSTNFPIANALQPTLQGGRDAFVAKLNAEGSDLVFSTYLGGGGAQEGGTGIFVDSAGNSYVTGFTNSPDFPTANAIQPTLGGESDAFITKLNTEGSALIYSTYLGGSGREHEIFFFEAFVSGGIAIDASGNAYVTGFTESSNFPTVNPVQPTPGGGSDAFVAKIAPVEVIDLQGSVAVGGAPVVGTRVKLKNLATAVKSKTTTDAAGAYQCDPVASGNYKVGIGTFVVGAPTTVSGTLTVKGAPSVGTKVKLKNKTTGAVLKTTTDASGNFSFAGAAAGTSKITISPVPVP